MANLSITTINYRIQVIKCMLNRIEDGTNYYARLSIGSGINSIDIDENELQVLLKYYEGMLIEK